MSQLSLFDDEDDDDDDDKYPELEQLSGGAIGQPTRGVGQSQDRTPGKHRLLKAILGREAGVLACGGIWLSGHPRYHIDLCAGDGRPTYSSGTSSPQIFQRYTEMLRRKMPVDLWMIEKSSYTFDVLRENVTHHPRTLLVCDDSRNPGAVPGFSDDPNASAFIHNDPNNIHSFALSDELVGRLPKFTTTLSTLGCNVGSLKRLPEEDRLGWYDHVARVTEMMAGHHDALLVALNNDASQWAYLITGPQKWHDEGKYEGDARAAFASWGKGVTYCRFRTQRSEFAGLCDQLFRTKAERGE